MAFVRLLVEYDDNQAGELVNLPATVARQLVAEGKALDGEDIYDYEPKREKATVNYEKRVTLLDEDFPEKDRLVDAGYDTIEKIKNADDKELLDIKYIGKKTLNEIREAT